MVLWAHIPLPVNQSKLRNCNIPLLVFNNRWYWTQPSHHALQSYSRQNLVGEFSFLSRGILWNFPRVTCIIFLGIHKYVRRKCFTVDRTCNSSSMTRTQCSVAVKGQGQGQGQGLCSGQSSGQRSSYSTTITMTPCHVLEFPVFYDSILRFIIWKFFNKSLNINAFRYINVIYLITWNFRDTLISRFWGAHISRHLNFAILWKFCILNHFNFAFLSETQLTFSWQYILICPWII